MTDIEKKVQPENTVISRVLPSRVEPGITPTEMSMLQNHSEDKIVNNVPNIVLKRGSQEHQKKTEMANKEKESRTNPSTLKKATSSPNFDEIVKDLKAQ